MCCCLVALSSVDTKEDDGPFCGNKIVEDGEECDCGYDQKECTEQCCYPREVEPYLESDPNAKVD